MRSLHSVAHEPHRGERRNGRDEYMADELMVCHPCGSLLLCTTYGVDSESKAKSTANHGGGAWHPRHVLVGCQECTAQPRHVVECRRHLLLHKRL